MMLALHIITIIVLAVGCAYTGMLAFMALWWSKLAGGTQKAWPFVLAFCLCLGALIFVTYNPGWMGDLWSLFPQPPNPVEVLA